MILFMFKNHAEKLIISIGCSPNVSYQSNTEKVDDEERFDIYFMDEKSPSAHIYDASH